MRVEEMAVVVDEKHPCFGAAGRVVNILDHTHGNMIKLELDEGDVVRLNLQASEPILISRHKLMRQRDIEARERRARRPFQHQRIHSVYVLPYSLDSTRDCMSNGCPRKASTSAFVYEDGGFVCEQHLFAPCKVEHHGKTFSSFPTRLAI